MPQCRRMLLEAMLYKLCQMLNCIKLLFYFRRSNLHIFYFSILESPGFSWSIGSLLKGEDFLPHLFPPDTICPVFFSCKQTWQVKRYQVFSKTEMNPICGSLAVKRTWSIFLQDRSLLLVISVLLLVSCLGETHTLSVFLCFRSWSASEKRWIHLRKYNSGSLAAWRGNREKTRH